MDTEPARVPPAQPASDALGAAVCPYIIKMMGYRMTFRPTELDHLKLEGAVGAAAADALLPIHAPIQEPIQPNGEAATRFDCPALPPPGPPDPEAAKERWEIRGPR